MTYTVVEMTKFSVCVSRRVIHGCFCDQHLSHYRMAHARNSGRNFCRSTCTTSAIISLSKRKLTLKTGNIAYACMV